MVAIHETDGLGLGADLEHLRGAAELKSLIMATMSPSTSTLPYASLTTRSASGASAAASSGHSWPQVMHSYLSAWAATSFISHMGQAGWLIKRGGGMSLA